MTSRMSLCPQSMTTSLFPIPFVSRFAGAHDRYRDLSPRSVCWVNLLFYRRRIVFQELFYSLCQVLLLLFWLCFRVNRFARHSPPDQIVTR